MDTLPYTEPFNLNNRDNSSSSVIVPLDIRGKEIARGIIAQNDHKLQVVKVIDMDEGRYVDVREWNKYGKEQTFGPTKHGLMIRSDVFKEYMISVLNNSLKYC